MMLKREYPKMRWLAWLSMLALLAPMLGSTPSFAQAGSRTFPETGKAVKGKFLQYWDSNGGLAQQGFPISEEIQERSDTDGKTYTVQYFERATFELHPENAPPNDVLLSLLGVFRYQKKYPSGAPNQTPNADLNFQVFPQTGKRVGGIFLDYWKSHGGLAQQGLPISEEFTEVSDLNQNPYKVQYFERAVFEFHPENPPPNNVLLSQLGKFRFDEKRGGTQPPPPPPPPTPGGGQPTARPTTPPAQPTPTTPPAPACDLGGGRNGTATPNQAKAGDVIRFEAFGFIAGEGISFWFTLPTGEVEGTAQPVPGGAGPDGRVRFNPIPADLFTDVPGRWALTVQGERSGPSRAAVIPFCISR